jgi:hypothetical protein
MYGSLSSSLGSIVRGGPSELFRGFLASSLRDATYAGLFLVVYEATKHEAASILPPSTPLVSAALHSGSAATAGTLATLATHPFDVIKVPFLLLIFSQENALTLFNRQGCKFVVDTNTVAFPRQPRQYGTSVHLLAPVPFSYLTGNQGTRHIWFL